MSRTKESSSDVFTIEKCQESDGPTTYGFGWRHILTLLTYVGFVVMFTLRVNLSVGLVAMVNHTALKENGSLESICNPDSDHDTVKKVDGPFVWDNERQGIILASYFYGYIVTQIPGGILAGRYGAKWVLGIGLVLAAILTLFTPLAVQIGSGMFIALLVLEGISTGIAWPAIQTLYSRWAPPSERSKLSAFAAIGISTGIPLAFALSGVMIEANMMGGWPSVFYIFGISGCVWFLFWAVLASSSPEEHRFISVNERMYIVKSIEKEAGKMMKPGFLDVPWKKILKSPAVWSVFAAHFSFNWSLYVLHTALPTYFKRVLGFDIMKNGLLSALPYFCQAIVHITSGCFADTLRSKWALQTVTIRKWFDFLGHILPAIFVVAVGHVGCNSTAAVTCLVLSVGLSGLCGGGFLVNFLDIAPQFAGILFGISNTIATVPGIIGPYITGVITKSNTIESWRTVFYIVGSIYLVSAVFYALFAQGTIQDWAQQKKLSSRNSDLK